MFVTKDKQNLLDPASKLENFNLIGHGCYKCLSELVLRENIYNAQEPTDTGI